MALTLPVKHIVINGTERKEYYRKRKPWWTNELSELLRSGARQKNCTVRVTMILRGNYAGSFCLINETLMMRFDVQKDAIGLRNRKKYCQSTSPMLSGRKWVQWG